MKARVWLQIQAASEREEMIAKTHTVCLGGTTLNIDVLETLDFSSEDLDISL